MKDLLPYVALFISISGWFVSSYLSHKYKSTQSKNEELNKKIDDLHVALFCIRNELLELIDSGRYATTGVYLRFVSMVSNVHFICECIEKLDPKQSVKGDLIKKLRQSCTNDEKYKPENVISALQEFEMVEREMKKYYQKVF